MNDIRLIATDLDDTLLHHDGTVPRQFSQVASELEYLGVHMVLASGRSLHTLQVQFPELAKYASFICDNGAVIYTHGRLVAMSQIAPAIYHRMFDDIRKVGAIPIICGPGATYMDRQDVKHRSALARFFNKISATAHPNVLDVPADKISAFFPNGITPAGHEQICNAYAADYTVTPSDDSWLDITNRGVNKGAALQHLGASRGVEATEMVSFGNTDNDREMLQLTRYSYIVENATNGMTKYARFRTASCDDEGVMQVLQQILQSKRRDQAALIGWASGR
ncbi:HAD family hydrolase [Lacticaseibacillus pabuli]|uniref:HAD family hydrolase n=1 Tax=Lacticaseibacillus pabuli TaxID=3025672 RepID=A0ABY7WRB5_9LACO|nr:HAD family hydrolase [Lacticaseibacillus sp. KACC 23028]WDF82651.1 HAD family hydrolase [Lacticaseibacillus sp. KACC 23028]